MTAEPKTIGDLIEARLKTLVGVTVYRGEVPGKPPVIQTDGSDDPSGRVAPYVVLYTGAGDPEFGPSLGGAAVNLMDDFQTTVVAGWEPDCIFQTGRVAQHLNRWRPEHGSMQFGWVRPPVGYNPGNARRDDTVTPVRFSVPLLWRLAATS